MSAVGGVGEPNSRWAVVDELLELLATGFVPLSLNQLRQCDDVWDDRG